MHVIQNRMQALIIAACLYDLDILFQAIERLSSNDPKLMQSSCDIMNKVFTKGKDLQKMIEKLENEKKLNQAPINEGMIKKTVMQHVNHLCWYRVNSNLIFYMP